MALTAPNNAQIGHSYTNPFHSTSQEHCDISYLAGFQFKAKAQ